jgi:hypothetical protein
MSRPWLNSGQEAIGDVAMDRRGMDAKLPGCLLDGN